MKGFIDAVMRSGAVPVFLLRKDGLIMEANRAGCQRFVVEQEQLLNLHLQDFIVGSTRTDFQALLGRATAQQLVSGTYRFLRARGKEFVASVSLVGVADAKGTVSRILVTMEGLRVDDSVPEAEGRV
jgi:PAS domain S-box-containing protein